MAWRAPAHALGILKIVFIGFLLTKISKQRVPNLMTRLPYKMYRPDRCNLVTLVQYLARTTAVLRYEVGTQMCGQNP